MPPVRRIDVLLLMFKLLLLPPALIFRGHIVQSLNAPLK